MPEWASVKPEDRLATVQIKSDVTKLSTDALAQSWVDFPIAGDLNAANNVQVAMNFFMANFNGLVELAKRNDGGTVLLKRYLAINYSCFDGLTETAKAKFSNYTEQLEIILTQDVFLAALSADQKKQLAAKILEIYAEKEKTGWLSTIEAPACLGVRLMLAANYTPFVNEMQTAEMGFTIYLLSNKRPAYSVILLHLKNFAK